MALAKNRMLSAAVRAAEVAVVLHQTQHRHLHHIGHAHGLADDHGNQLLRRGDDDHAVDGQGLKHRQRHIARSGRHIDEHIVHVLPDDVRPELLDRARDDRPAPQHGVAGVVQQQVDGHDLDAGLADGRMQAAFLRPRTLLHAEGLRDGRAGDVRVQDRGPQAAALHLSSQHGRDRALADAALAGHDGNDLFDLRPFIQLCKQTLLLALSAAFAAACTVAAAILTHGNSPLFFDL